MLNKLENIYLAALRVLILILATLALAVGAFAFVRSTDFLMDALGLSQPRPPEGSTLQEYITQKRATSVRQERTTATSGETANLPASAVAKAIAKYINAHHKLEVVAAKVEVGLQKLRDEVSVGEQAAYDTSLLKLVQELSTSKGKPLSVEQIEELIAWHHESFDSDAENLRVERAMKASEGKTNLTAGTIALAGFIGLIFFFIMVKIERNLRFSHRSASGEERDGNNAIF